MRDSGVPMRLRWCAWRRDQRPRRAQRSRSTTANSPRRSAPIVDRRAGGPPYLPPRGGAAVRLRERARGACRASARVRHRQGRLPWDHSQAGKSTRPPPDGLDLLPGLGPLTGARVPSNVGNDSDELVELLCVLSKQVVEGDRLERSKPFLSWCVIA